MRLLESHVLNSRAMIGTPWYFKGNDPFVNPKIPTSLSLLLHEEDTTTKLFTVLISNPMKLENSLIIHLIEKTICD